MSEMSQGKSSWLRELWTRRKSRCMGLRDDHGDALIELAVLFSLVGLPLLLGTVQMGFLVYDSVEISNAANAGALYGMQTSGYAASSAGITSAAQAEAADFGTKLTVTPTTYYACTNAVNGTQYPTSSYTQAQATAKCTGTGNAALEFIQVLTSASVTPAIHCPGLPATYTLTGTSVMEVEQ
jgi:Flp pilus assembly protein TadG